MKPFNRIEMVQGKPVVTRDGRKVVWITEVPAGYHVYSYLTFPIVGLIEGDKAPEVWTIDGLYSSYGCGENNRDLFMAPTKKVGWIAFGEPIGLSIPVGFCTHVWTTEEEAKKYYRSTQGVEPKGTQFVEWEE